MTELRVTSRVDPSCWNELVRACHGTVFHSAEWADFVEADQRGVRGSFYTMLEADGSVGGLAVGFRAASSRTIAAPFTGSSWLDALPAVPDNNSTTVSCFIRLLEQHSRRAGDVTFRVGSYASPGSEAVLEPLGFSLSARLEFELDLTRDEASLWMCIDHRRRQRINGAKKAGVEVRELPYAEGVSHLRRLQAASFARISARGGPSLAERDWAEADPIAALARAGIGRLAGGFVDGICVSASLFTSFNGVAYHALSGHDSKGLQTQAPSLVLWEMCRRFKGEGAQRLNFGGCGISALDQSDPEHGVYSYKRAFGGTRLECASGEKILRPGAQRAANLLRRVVG